MRDVACREKTEKFTPSGVMVAPRGRGWPGLVFHFSKFLRLFQIIGLVVKLVFFLEEDWVPSQKSRLNIQVISKYETNPYCFQGISRNIKFPNVQNPKNYFMCHVMRVLQVLMFRISVIRYLILFRISCFVLRISSLFGLGVTNGDVLRALWPKTPLHGCRGVEHQA